MRPAPASQLTDTRRHALATVEDLVERVQLLRTLTAEAGRPADAVGISLPAWIVTYGHGREIAAAEERICAEWGPIGLTHLILRDEDLERPDVDTIRFGKEVIPHLE